MWWFRVRWRIYLHDGITGLVWDESDLWLALTFSWLDSAQAFSFVSHPVLAASCCLQCKGTAADPHLWLSARCCRSWVEWHVQPHRLPPWNFSQKTRDGWSLHRFPNRRDPLWENLRQRWGGEKQDRHDGWFEIYYVNLLWACIGLQLVWSSSPMFFRAGTCSKFWSLLEFLFSLLSLKWFV